MAFRGFGDDALKVKADKREAALKAAQIAASERASMRSANVQMAGLQENARQADMANQRAGEQLAAGNERFDKQLAQAENARVENMNLQREQLADKIVSGQEKRALDEVARREAMAATEEARKDDLSVKIADMSQRERQLQLNESVAARLEQEWQQKQAVQEELQREDTATQLAVIRAASLSSGPVGMPYINALNDLRGVAYGDPGSTTQVFPVIDPQTGARLGIGTVKIGEDGKEIQSILDPAAIIPQVRASMAPDKWEEYAQRLIGGNTAKGSDRVTAAALREMQKTKLEFGKIDPGSLMKTLAEQEDNLRFTKAPKRGTSGAADPANQENLDRVGRIKTNLLKELEAQTGGGDEAPPTATLTPEQQAFVTPPPKFSLEDQARFTQAVKDAGGDKAKASELYKAAKAKQAEVAKRRAGGDETPADEAAASTAPKDGGDLTSKIEELNAKGEFDTKLDPGEELEFKAWKQKYAPKDSGMDYDLRGAFKAGEKPGADGHWTDKFKKPNHPTFSDQSQYAQGEFKRLAGTWKGDKFVPSAPEAKNLAASQALRRQNAMKPTPAKAQAQPEEKDVRSKFFPPVRGGDEPLGDYNQKFEQWVNDNPWYRALQEAISPRTKESSLLPPVRKANETPAAHNARYQRWLKDNPLMRFFEGLKSEPGSKPGEKWDAVVKKS